MQIYFSKRFYAFFRFSDGRWEGAGGRAVLGATIVGGSSGRRGTPSIAIVLYDCHVSTNIGVSHHTSVRYNGIPFKVVVRAGRSCLTMVAISSSHSVPVLDTFSSSNCRLAALSSLSWFIESSVSS